MDISEPNADSHGGFESVVGNASSSWPWAFPHYYAVNSYAAPDIGVVGCTASPDGSSEVKTGMIEGRTIVEFLVFWDGKFAVERSRTYMTRERALAAAKSSYSELPVRYLMSNAKVVSENVSVEITGAWPKLWKYESIRDLGIFLAYLDQQVRAADEDLLADQVKMSIRVASTPTEVIVNYIESLETAKDKFRGVLNDSDKYELENAIGVAKGWIQR